MELIGCYARLAASIWTQIEDTKMLDDGSLLSHESTKIQRRRSSYRLERNKTYEQQIKKTVNGRVINY